MRFASRTAAAAVVLLAAAGPGLAQGRDLSFRAGLGAETSSRLVRSGDEKRESSLSSLGTGLRLEMTFRNRVTLSLLAGMSFTDAGGLVFYRLPVALEYRAGSVSGMTFGAEIAARALTWGAFELDGRARFLASTGSLKTWPMNGFAVPGEARSKPNWTALEAGPQVSYNGLKNVVPYLFAVASWLSGDILMEETLEDLQGDQTLSIKGAGLVRTGAGATLALGRRASLRAEAGLTPRRGGADYDARLALLYSF